MGPTAAAIANALHDALGVRVRDLPLTPERIAARDQREGVSSTSLASTVLPATSTRPRRSAA